MNFVARNLNLAIKQSRKFSSSFLPVTPPPLVTSPQKGSEYKFFGIVKRNPHYINKYNEVYTMKNGVMVYHADWLDQHKMLWTDYPLTYRLVTFKNMNYFYDIEHNDAYYYDKDIDVIIPAGFYNHKNHTFNNTYYWGGV